MKKKVIMYQYFQLEKVIANRHSQLQHNSLLSKV